MPILGFNWEDPFRTINAKLDRIIMSQADIDSAVTAVQGLLSDISTQTASILADVQAFAANPSDDTTQLDTAVAGIQQVQTALDSAVTQLGAAAPVTPPPAPGTPAAG